MTDPVPPFEHLGIVSVQGVGGPPGISEVVMTDRPWWPSATDRFVFCEGYASGSDGFRYAWEVWTREELDRVGARESEGGLPSSPERVIARVDLLGDEEHLAEVREKGEQSGWRWTQIVVPAPWFGSELLERIRTAPASERHLFFSRCRTEYEPDDDPDDAGSDPDPSPKET
jgi:hypothetical protein